MFIPEEVFPKVPAKLNLNLLPEFEERKEEDLNPPPDYGKLNAEYEEEKREEQQVTILPLEQTGHVQLTSEKPEFVWKDPYYISKRCAYKRIVQVKDKTKKQKAKIYYKKTKLKDVKFPESKKKEESKDFDTFNWNFEYPDNNWKVRDVTEFS